MSAPQSPAPHEPRFFAFDEAGSTLELLPLASRRALDHAGIKLSLASYQRLGHADRVRLAAAGSGTQVDLHVAQEIADQADPQARRQTPALDPSAESATFELKLALGPERPLSDKVWQSLSSLERYALVKVASKPNAPRLGACYDEVVGAKSVSTHLKAGGGVVMVSIANKQETERTATAESWVSLSADAFERLISAKVPKGDVLQTARLAGIMATKKTSDLIPLCHPLALAHADIEFELLGDSQKIRILCTVVVLGRTGVEMEAMVGASVAGLTVYDMLKAIDRSIILGPTQLLRKSGGRSGDYQLSQPSPTSYEPS